MRAITTQGEVKKMIRGSLYYIYPEMTKEQCIAELDAMQAVGFDVLWINGSVFNAEYLRSLTEADAEGPLDWLFAEAEKRNMKAVAEIMSRPDWFKHWDAEEDYRLASDLIDELVSRYGHYESFWAFYFGYELYVVEGEQLAYCKRLWKRLADYCKMKKPSAKLTISPFFITDQHEILGPYPYAKPEQYTAFWEEIFSVVPFDILMLQDSGEHVSFITIEERRPYFAAVKQACDRYGVELWGNVEFAEVNVKDYEELLEFRGGFGNHADGDGFHNVKWIQVPMPRLIDKMNLAAEYSEHLISWGFQQFVSPYSGKQGAGDYFAAYQALWRQYVAKGAER